MLEMLIGKADMEKAQSVLVEQEAARREKVRALLSTKMSEVPEDFLDEVMLISSQVPVLRAAGSAVSNKMLTQVLGKIAGRLEAASG